MTMKKMIVMAGLLAAASAIPAMAQDWRNGRGERGAAQAERGERGDRGGGQRGQAQAAPAPAPQVQAPQQAQASRGDSRRNFGGQPGGNGQAWQGRRNFDGQATALGVPLQQGQRFRDRDGDGIRNRRDVDVNGDGRADFGRRDRDGDGVRNGADRDRDGDGIRNRRDFDANGNGRVDPRWDRNRDGRVDPRFDRNNNGRPDARWGGRPGYGGGNWNRDWRSDRRYDWHSYRNYNRRLFTLPRYYAPYGWNYGYRRFSIGIYLDSLLFSRDYWISDPYQYRLPPAYPPYHWVRYYNDALLIDERSGYVVDAMYDFFY
jgi:hypothetical protein